MLQGLIILLLFIAACVIGLPVGFAIGFTTWFSFLMLDGKIVASTILNLSKRGVKVVSQRGIL